MISIIKRNKGLALFLGCAMAVLSSCNKDLEQFAEAPAPELSSLRALGDTLGSKARANDSLYFRLVVKSGLLPVINSKLNTYTLFVPDNNAMRVFINAISGGLVPLSAPDAVFSGFISANIPAPTAASIVGYNVVPQVINFSAITNVFPNFQYPTILNPAPQISAFLRLTTFPTNRHGNYVNNIPVISVNNFAANGVIHEVAAVVVPPSQFLWDRINADSTPVTGLRYLKAAILRADSGTGTVGTLQSALLNIGANLTVFAPTDTAFKTILTGAIFKALVAQGVPPAIALPTATALASSPTVFQNPALYGALSARTVKGILVYHILGSRAFTNNFPETATSYPTLLNGAVPTHPGVSLTATFIGISPFAIAATVTGVFNPTASNILINNAPAPFGTSDQHYLNGVLHKIDQVLIPAPL
ncbi:MAG: fasciclin domain-containing protein [Ferruginibacter sp.]